MPPIPPTSPTRPRGYRLSVEARRDWVSEGCTTLVFAGDTHARVSGLRNTLSITEPVIEL